MKFFRTVLALAALTVFVVTGSAFGAEYYVTESGSGILAVTDHKPKGGAKIVKGPFKNKDEADKAMTEVKAGQGKKK